MMCRVRGRQGQSELRQERRERIKQVVKGGRLFGKVIGACASEWVEEWNVNGWKYDG